MKVLTGYIGFRKGGCYRRLQKFVKAGVAAGWTVHYVSTSPPEVSRSEKLIYHRVPAPAWSVSLQWAGFIFLASPLVAWLALRERLDVIAGFEMAGIVGVPTRILVGTPLLTFKRGDDRAFLESRKAGFLEGFLWRELATLLLRWSDRIFPVSRYLADFSKETFGIREEQLEVLPNNATPPVDSPLGEGEELPALPGIPDGCPVVGYLGTLIPRKSVDTLVRAVALLDPSVHLVISGDGSERERLQDMARESGLEGRAHFLGWRRDPGRVLERIDVNVMPSLIDDCPNGLLEGLAAGKICLGTRGSGIQEILQHESLMFPARDADALAERLRAALFPGEEQDALRALCRDRAEAYTFDWDEKVTRAVESAIRDLRPGLKHV